ncbi:MAG: DUF4124 domain-containing protein [Gammaproteobacteria bacterium]|nr:DUF4124 domain-containing protein [Gammaproteobacteria bacterium]
MARPTDESAVVVTDPRLRKRFPATLRTAWIGMILANAGVVTPTCAETIYRCSNGSGHAEFSAQPCGTGAEAVEIKSEPATGVDMGVGGDFSGTVAANRTRERERGIARQEQRIRTLLHDRDDRLAELRARQAQVGKTRDSATQRRLIAAEIRTVTNAYNARLRLERDRLAQLARP